MMMPGMGVDPEKMMAMQRVSQFINSVIRVDYKAKTVTVSMASDHSEAAALIPGLLDQFSTALATQLSSIFAIKGEIVEVNKPES